MQLNTEAIFGIKNSTINLYPFQASCAQWMRYIEYNIGDPRNMAGGIIGNDMGMGKTPTTSILVAATPVPSTLILTTPSTRYSWIENIIKTGFRASVYTIDEGRVYRCSLFKNKNGVEEIHQTTLKANETMSEPMVLVSNYQLVTNGTVNDRLITNFIWWRIIIDEAAFLRNTNDSWDKLNNIKQPTIQNGAVKQRLGSRWCITGTPIQTGGNSDLINIFRWIDDRFLRGKIESEWKNELLSLISTNLYRLNKNQISHKMKVIMQYPEIEPITENVSIRLQESNISRYLENLSYQDIIDVCSRGDNDSKFIINAILTDERCFMIVKACELKEKFKGETYGSFKETEGFRTMISYPFASVPLFLYSILGNNISYTGRMGKIEQLKSFLSTGQSFVCFHHYENIAIKIARTVKEFFPNYVVLEISGKIISDFQRHKIVQTANTHIDNGRSVILISSTKATAEGMNYQKFSRIIMFDPEYNQKTDEQAKARVQRIGQKNQVYIYELILEDFKTYYGNISVDRRIQSIRDERTHLSDIIDHYNAAFSWRRYRTLDPETGHLESGINFGDSFEIGMNGKPGGPDSVGPEWIQ